MAASDATVLITGESGTGKEVVARAIHAASTRRYNPMVVVNCGALPEGILESELFGHEAGAFTGARARHKGKFESAEGGTVFLDEIGEVSPKVQVELLRVLEEKVVTRLGGTTPVPVDFRTIAATNRDLQAAVKEGRFREDLYWRLNVVHVHIPPLRERPEDVPVLAEQFLAKFAQSMSRRPMRFSPRRRLDALASYPWPGNVRELQNAIERAVVVGRGDVVTAADLPLRVTQGAVRARRRPRLARRGRARARAVGARRERLEHHAGRAHPRRRPRDALQQDQEVRPEEAGRRGLRRVPGEAALLAEAVDLLPVGRAARRGRWRRSPRAWSRFVELPVHVLPPARARAPAHRRAATSSTPAPSSRRSRSRARRRARLLVGVAWDDIAVPALHVRLRPRAPGRPRVRRVASRGPTPRSTACPPTPTCATPALVAEILHELGHLATLEHCPDRGCVMSFAGNIERADIRGSRFCAGCAARLPAWLRGPARLPELV